MIFLRTNGIDLYKIYHKLGQCFIKTKQYKRGVENLKLALHHIKTTNIDEKVKNDFSNILVDSIKKFVKREDNFEDKIIEYKISKPNPNDHRINDSVEIIEVIGMGRTAFAKEDIPVGNLLVVDKGIGSHLNPDDKENTIRFCLHCMRNVEQVQPNNFLLAKNSEPRSF